MDKYTQSNRDLSDEWAVIHARSSFYDVNGFKAGRWTLRPLELEALGDVTDKTLRHLQCHFGLDTLSWARRGAHVTGMDFSERAITFARALSQELGIPATFVLSTIAELPTVLQGAFDTVFTSYGVLTWLPDLGRWGQVIAHFLKPGGTFFIAEFHPFAQVFDDAAPDLHVRYPYFAQSVPLALPLVGSYADRTATVSKTVEYAWPHPLNDVINTLISAGLRIEALHEYPYAYAAMMPSLMEENEAREWRLREQREAIPLMYAIKATKGLPG